MALPIWGFYMNKAYEDKDLEISQEDFERPLGFIVDDCETYNQKKWSFEENDPMDEFEDPDEDLDIE